MKEKISSTLIIRRIIQVIAFILITWVVCEQSECCAELNHDACQYAT